MKSNKVFDKWSFKQLEQTAESPLERNHSHKLSFEEKESQSEKKGKVLFVLLWQITGNIIRTFFSFYFLIHRQIKSNVVKAEAKQ
jgi:hypothetical protein